MLTNLTQSENESKRKTKGSSKEAKAVPNLVFITEKYQATLIKLGEQIKVLSKYFQV
jgi:hypothetical protein